MSVYLCISVCVCTCAYIGLCGCAGLYRYRRPKANVRMSLQNYVLLLLLLFCLFVSFKTVSLCSPGCSGTSSVDQAVLPLPPGARMEGTHHHIRLQYHFCTLPF